METGLVLRFFEAIMDKSKRCLVGRVARAGRSGLAISLVDSEELPYLMDLFVFLGRQVLTSHLADSALPTDSNSSTGWPNELLGSCPRDLISVDVESVSKREVENTAVVCFSSACF